MTQRRRMLICIVLAVVVAAVGIAAAIFLPHGSSSNHSAGSSSKNDAVPTAEVTAPQHVQIDDATGTPSVPPRPQVCQTKDQVNIFIQGLSEVSDTQHVSGDIICQDGWLYAPLNGPTLQDGTVAPATYLVLVFIDNGHGGGNWVLASYGEEHKQPPDSDLCRMKVPDKIRALTCTG